METALTTSEGGNRGRREERLEGRVETKVLPMFGDSIDFSDLNIPEEIRKTADQYDQKQKYAGIAEEIEQARQECERAQDYLSHLRISWVNWENHVPDFAQLAGSYA